MRHLLVIGTIAVTTVFVLNLAGPPSRTGNGAPAAASIDPNLPLYVKKDRVVCPQYAVLDAYLDGHRDGGEEEGHRRVVDLFFHPKEDCYRTFGRERVELYGAFKKESLVTIRCDNPLSPKCDVRPDDLEN